MIERLFALLPERMYERHLGRRYARQQARADERWLESPRYKQIKACGHKDRRPNPKATAIHHPSSAWICNDCGIGIVVVAPKSTEEA